MAEEVHTSQYSMQWVRHWGEVQKKLTYQHYGGNEDVSDLVYIPQDLGKELEIAGYPSELT